MNGIWIVLLLFTALGLIVLWILAAYLEKKINRFIDVADGNIDGIRESMSHLMSKSIETEYRVNKLSYTFRFADGEEVKDWVVIGNYFQKDSPKTSSFTPMYIMENKSTKNRVHVCDDTLLEYKFSDVALV